MLGALAIYFLISLLCVFANDIAAFAHKAARYCAPAAYCAFAHFFGYGTGGARGDWERVGDGEDAAIRWDAARSSNLLCVPWTDVPTLLALRAERRRELYVLMAYQAELLARVPDARQFFVFSLDE